MNEETPDETTTPSDAFGLLAHETRVRILEALTTTPRPERPVRFSTLRERVGDVDSARFNYHLGELTGHFLERTEAGYDFRRPGRRMAQAIRSGTVAGSTFDGLRPVDQSCHHCGSAVEITYRAGRVGIYCTTCDGTYGTSNYQSRTDEIPDDYGFLGLHALPPAGAADRRPTAVLDAAHRWALRNTLSVADDLCPRCGATFETVVDVCRAHDTGDCVCDACDYRHAVVYTAHCSNCTFDRRLPFGTMLVGTPAVVAFVASHGVDPTGTDYETFSTVFKTYEERVLDHEPFRGAFTFRLGGDDHTVIARADLSVESGP